MTSVDPRTKLLDELAERYVSPTMKAAGFRKLGKRRWLAGRAPDNLTLVSMHPGHSDARQVGFWVEWSVIPATICDFMNQLYSRPKRPNISWGILAKRVDVPFEMAVPFNINVESSFWVFSMSDGIDECGTALRRVLTEGGLVDRLLRMGDREHLLQVLDGKTGFSLPTYTPPEWPWRYLVMYIDDGDPAILEEMLAPLEKEFSEPDPTTPWRQDYHELSAWLRQRLDVRMAERQD